MQQRYSRLSSGSGCFGDNGFKLPLRTCVVGQDSRGNSFEENTVISYISYHGSSFWLTTSVTEGADLQLIIDLPPNLCEDLNLKLIIRGRVVFVESDKPKSPKNRVSLRFGNKYVISPDARL